MKVFMESIGKQFMRIEPERDYYYLMLKDRQDAVSTAFRGRSCIAAIPSRRSAHEF